MPYRLLITSIPLHIEAEGFYDYIRSHAGGRSVTNALLITTPNASSGAALVDYSTKHAADAAREADLFVDGVRTEMKAIGPNVSATSDGEADGRRAYAALLKFPSKRPKRARVCAGSLEADVAASGETTLRLVGAFEPNAAYAGGCFDAIAAGIRRATLGELRSLRALCEGEWSVCVDAQTAEALLERGRVALEGKDGTVWLHVRHARPEICLDGGNFELAKKHEVLEALARVVEVSGGKVAGFVDRFGNLLLPNVTKESPV